VPSSPTPSPDEAGPRTEAGKALADGIVRGGPLYRDAVDRSIRAIEEQAATEARRELQPLLETLADHIDGFHGECHCRRKLDDAIVAPSEKGARG
jgi:hypothetical protein